MKKLSTIGLLMLGVFFFSGCSHQPASQNQATITQNQKNNQSSSTSVVEDNGAANSACGGQVKDSDGNSYGTVQVGTQCWMSENMNVGVKIAGGSEPSDNQKIEKWCYEDSAANCTTDGGLYSWNEAMQYSTLEGAQGICTDGWHIPFDTEWHILENYLKEPEEVCDSARRGYDCASAGTKLMSGGSSAMKFPLAGYRDIDGSFYLKGKYARLWSATEASTAMAWYRDLNSGYTTVYRNNIAEVNGYSVRCLKN